MNIKAFVKALTKIVKDKGWRPSVVPKPGVLTSEQFEAAIKLGLTPRDDNKSRTKDTSSFIMMDEDLTRIINKIDYFRKEIQPKEISANYRASFHIPNEVIPDNIKKTLEDFAALEGRLTEARDFFRAVSNTSTVGQEIIKQAMEEAK